RHFDRKTRQEQRHPRHVAIVLAGLIGAAEDHVVDGERIDPAALDDGFDGHGSEIIRAYAGQRPAVLADGRADGSANESLARHVSRFPFPVSRVLTVPPTPSSSPYNCPTPRAPGRARTRKICSHQTGPRDRRSCTC